MLPDVAVALDLIGRGRYSEAGDLLERCIEAGAGDLGELRHWAGWCIELDPLGDQDAAIGFYRQAAADSRDPASRDRSLYRAGWVLMQQRRWDEAAMVFGTIVGESDESGPPRDEQRDARYWLAGCLEASGRYLDAMAHYRTCAQRFPAMAHEARFREIECLDHVGRFSEAVAACDAFDEVPFEGFDRERHQHLLGEVRRKRDLLASCLDAGAPRPEGPVTR